MRYVASRTLVLVGIWTILPGIGTCVFLSDSVAQQGNSASPDAEGAKAGENPGKSQPPRFDMVVRDDIFAGFNGDEEAMKRGIAMCDKVLRENPKHAEAMVWRGAGRVFLAGRAFSKKDTVNGMKLWATGLEDMDTAVALEPENIAVRIPRAAVLMPASSGVPEFMAKPLLLKAKEDFEKIYSVQKDSLDQLGEHPQGELRMGLADVYRRLGEAQKSKEQLEAIGATMPGTDYATRAKKWLSAEPGTKLFHNCIGCHEG